MDRAESELPSEFLLHRECELSWSVQVELTAVIISEHAWISELACAASIIIGVGCFTVFFFCLAFFALLCLFSSLNRGLSALFCRLIHLQMRTVDLLSITFLLFNCAFVKTRKFLLKLGVFFRGDQMVILLVDPFLRAACALLAIDTASDVD